MKIFRKLFSLLGINTNQCPHVNWFRCNRLSGYYILICDMGYYWNPEVMKRKTSYHTLYNFLHDDNACIVDLETFYKTFCSEWTKSPLDSEVAPDYGTRIDESMFVYCFLCLTHLLITVFPFHRKRAKRNAAPAAIATYSKNPFRVRMPNKRQ